jgi:hypothetical protein
VRRVVLPEPEGPIKRIEGSEVSPVALKTTEWRKIGIVIARRIAITRPTGDGFRRACAQSWIVVIVAHCVYKDMWYRESWLGTRLWSSDICRPSFAI